MVKLLSSVLRHIISIEMPITTNDGIEEWQEFAIARAEIKALYDSSGGEIFSAMQLMDNSYYRFTLRYLPDLKSNMRIKYRDHVFQIKRIINQNELNISTIIIAQETI